MWKQRGAEMEQSYSLELGFCFSYSEFAFRLEDDIQNYNGMFVFSICFSCFNATCAARITLLQKDMESKLKSH